MRNAKARKVNGCQAESPGENLVSVHGGLASERSEVLVIVVLASGGSRFIPRFIRRNFRLGSGATHTRLRLGIFVVGLVDESSSDYMTACAGPFLRASLQLFSCMKLATSDSLQERGAP